MILRLTQENTFAAEIATMRKNLQIIDCQQNEKIYNKNLQHLKPFGNRKGTGACGWKTKKFFTWLGIIHATGHSAKKKMTHNQH